LPVLFFPCTFFSVGIVGIVHPVETYSERLRNVCNSSIARRLFSTAILCRFFAVSSVAVARTRPLWVSETTRK
jgi:hypothetical protein